MSQSDLFEQEKKQHRAYPQDFEKMWVYWNKYIKRNSNKYESFKAFQKLPIDNNFYRKVCSTFPNYAKTVKEDGHCFLMQMSRYLNNKVYLDYDVHNNDKLSNQQSGETKMINTNEEATLAFYKRIEIERRKKSGLKTWELE